MFHRYAANFPWRSHAEWWLLQMRRWGHLDPAIETGAAADLVYRTDIYREAARGLGLPYPLIDRKPEGMHGGPWLLSAATGPIAMVSTAGERRSNGGATGSGDLGATGQGFGIGLRGRRPDGRWNGAPG